jgi:LCP family protein required for cell wall assembly
MAEEDDTYERFFRAREPEGAGGAEGAPPPPAAPPPSGVPSSPRTPGRRDRPTGAQERLMARIAASRRARQRRAFLVAGGFVSALVLFVAGAGWALTGYVNRLVGRVDAGTSAAPPGAPVNILLAGVDRRAGLTRHQQLALHVGNVPSTNSDTMMLVHISPAHGRVTVVSLPRDTWVNIPGHGMNKINAAYGLGGPKLMVQTVEQATGLTVNNYVEVGFLAFVKIVDAIGGVNVCLPVALNDPSSGISMRAGMHHVNGITALKYARDRHSFPLQDLTRIQDQQSLMSTALTKLLSSGTLANPLRLNQLLKTVLPALRVDKGLNIAALADQMRGITSRDVVFVTVPLGNVNYTTPTGQSAVQWNQSQAARLFSEIRSDQPVIKAAPPPHRARSHGHHHGSAGAHHHPAGWVPPGARTAAQAACAPARR